MSRIFDALQRLESERSGEEPSALPQGPELLRRAERRAADKWKGDSSRTDLPLQEKDEKGAIDPIDADSLSAKMAPDDVQRETNGSDSKLLESCPSLKISVSVQSRLVCLTDREGPTAEAIRLLGVRLKELRRTRPLSKLLITSTIPQEGKSTISANLACGLAQTSGERVLLLEGDLRRPSLLQIFGANGASGISDCVKDEGRTLAGVYRLEDADAGFCQRDKLRAIRSNCFSHMS